MRLKNLFSLAVAIASLGMVAAPQSASATDFGRADRPAVRSHVHPVRHSVHRHVYVDYAYDDPYAYSYTPRGYYPYYNSNYWGPPRIRRFRGHLPPYYAAWGAPRRDYHHVEWHNRHYGGHRRGDW
jgi:hypothetical protein